MPIRKKDDENGSCYQSTDDSIPKKSTRLVKLPKLQERRERLGRTAEIRNPARFLENSHMEEDIHLPCINGPSCNERQDLFRDKSIDVDQEHQAKMEFVVAGMTKRYRTVNPQQHTYISCAESCGSDIPVRRQLESGCMDNSGRSFRQEQPSRLSNAERELILDKKRQAMLELKDRRTKFLKKCSQEAQYPSGREKIFKKKLHNEPLLVESKKLKAKKKSKKERKARIKNVREIADDISKEENANESKRSNIFTDLHKVKNSHLNYENATCPGFLSTDLHRPFSKENVHPELKAEPFTQTSHVQKYKIQTHLPLPPIIQKTNTVPLPTICQEYVAVPVIPSVLENNQCMYYPVQLTSKDQKNGYQRVISPATQLNHKIPFPLLKEGEEVLYEANSSSSRTEDVSCFDDDSLTDTGYIFGIHAHVVTDEKLRKELRLDLRFAHTPVSKQKRKKTAKRIENETKEKDKARL